MGRQTECHRSPKVSSVQRRKRWGVGKGMCFWPNETSQDELSAAPPQSVTPNFLELLEREGRLSGMHAKE